MNRKRFLLENTIVYGFGSCISKLIPIIMLPIITKLLPDSSYYGLNDMVNIVISIGSTIAGMGMYDAMFRMFFEKEDIDYKKQVCSTAIIFVFFSSLIMVLLVIFFEKDLTKLFFTSGNYKLLLYISTINIFVFSLSIILEAPTRMENKRLTYIIVKTVIPLITYTISIILIKNKEYILALPLATLISNIITFTIFYIINFKWFSLNKINNELIHDLIKIGVPLVPNLLMYVAFSSCDRIMIKNIIGSSEVGIYGVGAKVASVSQIIYMAFASGWQYFAFSTMKNDDQVEMISNIFESLFVIFTITVFSILPFTKIIFNIFFTGDYLRAEKIFIYLFSAPLLLILFQVIGSQFLIVKRTWYSSMILFFGLIINIVLNSILIRLIGVEGAAVSTFFGYAISVIITAVVLKRMKLLTISNNFIITSILCAVVYVLWRLFFSNNFILSIFTCIIMILILVLLNKDVIVTVVNLKKND